MFKKLSEPYRFAPAKVSMDRIDAALEQGAQAEIQSPGHGNYKTLSMVTLKAPDGRIVDQWPLHGNINDGYKFVASYNRVLAARRPAQPQPPAGQPPQAPPGQPYPGPPDTTGWTTQMPRRRDRPPAQPWLPWRA